MKRRHRLFVTVLAVATALLLGELVIWLASPTEYMYPRYRFSAEYGLLPFPDVTMVHGKPRRFQFRYTVGPTGCRGVNPEPGGAGSRVVVTLGDSYGFGMGVPDGREFPAVMRRRLDGIAGVVNLSSPGWGLTQQIRRFVASGEAYDPDVVILQFCSNDPDDNLANRVTVLRGGRFEFRNSENSLNWIKKYMSRSFVQRTQLYNSVRTRASRAVLGRMAKRQERRLAQGLERADGASGGPKERVYIDLLEAFAARLHADGRLLLVISVDRQLGEFPAIERAVHDMESRGLLRYVEVLDWLEGKAPYESPEGHIWGERAHEAIGEGLADVVAGLLSHDGAPSGDAGR